VASFISSARWPRTLERMEPSQSQEPPDTYLLYLGVSAWLSPCLVFVVGQTFVSDTPSNLVSGWSYRDLVQMLGFAVGFLLALGGLAYNFYHFSFSPESKDAKLGVALCYTYVVGLLVFFVREKFQILRWSN